MKHAVLRSAAHNAVDSIASGCPLAFGIYEFGLWQELRKLPGQKLKVELISGCVLQPKDPGPRIRRVFGAIAGMMPDFLRKHGCNIQKVEAIEVIFERHQIMHQAARIVVTDKMGKSSSTHYEGWPLRRRKTRDHLGRLRKA